MITLWEICLTGGCDPANRTKEGLLPCSTVYKVSMEEGDWVEVACMRTARMYHQSVALRGDIYTIGGQDKYHR